MIVSCAKVVGHITVQDGGRVGQRALGIPRGGAADERGWRLANRLVGVLHAQPALEFAQATAELYFSERATVAWAGAAARLSVNGEAVQLYTRLSVEAGAVLRVAGPYDGRFGYLAIAGQWLGPRWRDSISPLRLGEEWVPGESILRTGSRVEVAGDVGLHYVGRLFSRPPVRPEVITLWPGPEYERYRKWIEGDARLIGGGWLRFEEVYWRVSRESNRVGVRLGSKAGAHAVKLLSLAEPIRSSPTLPGTVQVTPAGQLIIGLADGPTMGGYPRIGIVDVADLGSVAQAVRGLRFRFR